jgi:hypothetical protein
VGDPNAACAAVRAGATCDTPDLECRTPDDPIPWWACVDGQWLGCGDVAHCGPLVAEGTICCPGDYAGPPPGNGPCCIGGVKLSCDSYHVRYGGACTLPCPYFPPAEGELCETPTGPCAYDASCPPGSGPIRKLSFSCVGGVWTDTLGPGPTCEGPADAGPLGCESSGGHLTTSQCCLSASDFPETCGAGACSCAPANSHSVQVCQCPAGLCFDGTSCVHGGG